MSARRRLDQELVRRGLVASREAAQEAISEGRVTVAGAPADKPARLVAVDDPVAVIAAGVEWASRGGAKLDAALTRWPIPVEGRRCIDAGASTGGFTDVLLARGAASVHAVDVGRGQLHERLRRDPRVSVVDRTNVRTLDIEGVGGRPFEVVVADLSFISLRTVAPVLAGNIAATDAQLIWLVKPQFEAGRRIVSAGRGIVRDPAVWLEALVGVGGALRAGGAAIMGAMPSPLRGADGNVEFLLWARAHADGGCDAAEVASAAVAEVASAAVAEVEGT
ncbi:MAG: TlyA family RNA methyltransferase [Acidimicrobiales bacterium]